MSEYTEKLVAEFDEEIEAKEKEIAALRRVRTALTQTGLRKATGEVYLDGRRVA